MNATDKQIEFAGSLGQDLARLAGQDQDRMIVIQTMRNLWSDCLKSKQMMSSLIETMLATLRGWRTEDQSAPVEGNQSAPVEAPEGMHKVGSEIYKVQLAVHGSGRRYAKRLVVHDQGCHLGCGHGECGHTHSSRYSAEFEYAPGIVRTLSTDTLMTLDEAKEFGALYGTCCVCGRTLTNEASIEAGIGPVCAGKF